MTPRAPPQSDPKSDSKMGSGVAFDESLLGHFGVGLPESLFEQRFLRFAIAMPVADPEIASASGDKKKQSCVAI